MVQMKLIHITVRGAVQGIGYRYFVQDIGRQMGISGWVKNLLNGDVEIEASGDEETLEQFATAIRTRHPFARIEDMEVRTANTGETTGTGFTIIH